MTHEEMKKKVSDKDQKDREQMKLKDIKKGLDDFTKDGVVGILFNRRLPWADLYVPRETLEQWINDQIDG